MIFNDCVVSESLDFNEVSSFFALVDGFFEVNDLSDGEGWLSNFLSKIEINDTSAVTDLSL